MLPFSLNPDAQNFCSRNLFPYSEIRFMKVEFPQGNNYLLVDDFLSYRHISVYILKRKQILVTLVG